MDAELSVAAARRQVHDQLLAEGRHRRHDLWLGGARRKYNK